MQRYARGSENTKENWTKQAWGPNNRKSQVANLVGAAECKCALKTYRTTLKLQMFRLQMYNADLALWMLWIFAKRALILA